MEGKNLDEVIQEEKSKIIKGIESSFSRINIVKHRPQRPCKSERFGYFALGLAIGVFLSYFLLCGSVHGEEIQQNTFQPNTHDVYNSAVPNTQVHRNTFEPNRYDVYDQHGNPSTWEVNTFNPNEIDKYDNRDHREDEDD
jgi:hypothetical protein